MEGGVRTITGEFTLWFVSLSENTDILRAPFLTVVLLPVWVQQGSESGFVRWHHLPRRIQDFLPNQLNSSKICP